MAHKKGLGSSRNGRDSNPKMLGVKKFAGEEIRAGQIIVRQRISSRYSRQTCLLQDTVPSALRNVDAWLTGDDDDARLVRVLEDAVATSCA